MTPTIHVDVRLDGQCSVCGRKTTVFSAPDSDKSKCRKCIMVGVKKSQKK